MLATQCSKPAAIKAETGNMQSDDLVGDRPARIGKPNRQADEHVAQNALEEQCHDIGLDLATAVFNIDNPMRPPFMSR